MGTEPLVAIVDDDESIRETTKDLLESAGYSAVAFASGERLLRSRRLSRLDCLITDVRMRGMNGLELYEQLVNAKRFVPTILVSAFLDDRLRAQARKADIVCCLAKPFSAEELLACVRSAIHHRHQGTRSGPTGTHRA